MTPSDLFLILIVVLSLLFALYSFFSDRPSDIPSEFDTPSIFDDLSNPSLPTKEDLNLDIEDDGFITNPKDLTHKSDNSHHV